jgi:hypothetical protein
MEVAMAKALRGIAVENFYRMYLEKAKEAKIEPINEEEFNRQVDYCLYDYYVENVFEHPEQISAEDWKTVMAWK